MKNKFIEVTNGNMNWGKFMVSKFEPAEWALRAEIDGRPLLSGRGWDDRHVLVLDLQTGEGAIFFPRGSARADLQKHKIWVCPMYEPFLNWLYKQDLSDLDALPSRVDFTREEAPFDLAGYRRPGPEKK